MTTPAPPVRPARSIYTVLSTANAPEAFRREHHLGLHGAWPGLGPGEWIQVDLHDGSSRICSNQVGWIMLLGQLQKLAIERGDQWSCRAWICRPKVAA